MLKHRHKFFVDYWQGESVCFKCKCEAIVLRKMTKEELKRSEIMLLPTKSTDVHRVWHKLTTKLSDDWEVDRRQDGKLANGVICKEFAKKHPDRVYVLKCDDSFHAGSDLVLVTHEAFQSWMGVTVLMFPQCDGRVPANFFLYPNHVDDLLRTLTKIQRHQRRVIKQQDKRGQAEAKWWNARVHKE